MRSFYTVVPMLILALFAVGICIGQEFVTDGLVSFWSFDKSTINGEKVADVWGNANGTMTDTSVVQGKINEGLEFNGSSSMVTIDMDKSLDITDAISMDAWIKISEWLLDPNRNIIIARYDQDAGKRDLQFSLNPDNSLATYMGHTNGTAYAQTQKGGQNQDWVDQWVHVAFTWDHSDGGLTKLYVDGEEIGSYLDQDPLEEPLLIFDIPWVVGAMQAQSRFFSGVIDELRIYDKRLSDDEVARNFGVKSNDVAVEPQEKLATLWGSVKSW